MAIDAHTISGLSEKEAERILQRDGFNELPSQKRQSAFPLLVKVISEPMLSLLLGIGGIYFFLGEMKDALMLLASAIVVIGITFYQEHKTGKTLDALRHLSSPRALVVRGGKQRRIPGSEVAVGDVVILHEGDRVPADGVVLSCENLFIDESLLTGESVPVRKIKWDGVMSEQRPGGDGLPFLYSGSLVVSGRAMAKVVKTGVRTEMGKIGKSLETIREEETLLHKETKRIVRFMMAIALFLCALVVLVYIFFKGQVVEGFLAGLTLSMAILPEEIPVILVVFLTLGAWRISKRKVLTRRSAAIEMLGAATVLCTDKTGTLTLNKMELANLYADGSFYEIDGNKHSRLPDAFADLLEYGILASQADPFDPIEKELYTKGEAHLTNGKHLHDNLTLIKEYHLSEELLAVSYVWEMTDDEEYIVASKGAPEAIIALCHVSAEKKTDLLERVKEMSDQGLRVLGVAKARIAKTDLPEGQADLPFEFSGFLGFVDPPRPSAPGAIKEAYGAGMRVIMITGDYPGTAQFVARKIGMRNTESFITGDELEAMDPRELQERIKTVSIFARVVPEQKLTIVNALKANNEIVAMTGDGVNDAPALKAAHIGIAMGERGTDVARESAALVLLNDDFSSIVAAVRLGRRIFDNLKRAIGYIFAVHVPIIGMSILPLFFDLPIVLLPAQIAFLEFIIDPACSTVFESEKGEEGIMKRPPRDLTKPMISRKTMAVSVVQGLGILCAIFLLFVVAVDSGMGELEARSLAFTSIVLASVMLIIVNLSWEKNVIEIVRTANKALYIMVAGAFAALGAILYIPFLSDLFHMVPLRASEFIYVIIAVSASLLWFEIVKRFKHRLHLSF